MISKNNQIKKITKIFIFASLIACVAQAEPPQKKKDFTHEFMVGLESFKYHYGEATPEQKNFMQFNGMMYGVNGTYQMTYKDMVFIRPEIRWSYGHTDYTAGKLGRDYERDQTPSMIIEPRLLVGSPLKATEQLTIAPYSGIGWRYKRDDDTDDLNKVNISGSNRIHRSLYIPIGTSFQYDLNNRWDLRGFIEYDWFIRGRQSTYSKEQILPNYRMEYIPATTVHKQKEGWGAKAQLLVGYRFDKVAVAFGPYMNFWHIQKSSLVSLTKRYKFSIAWGGGVHNQTNPTNEPNNTTKEIGLKVNFYF